MEGEHTYTFDGKDYTIIKTGGTYIYKTTSSKDKILEYVITINKGNLTTENNNNVMVTVNVGSIENGNFSDKGYSVNNNYIENLLNGTLTDSGYTLDDKSIGGLTGINSNNNSTVNNSNKNLTSNNTRTARKATALGENLNGDLGAIESGRRDSSHENDSDDDDKDSEEE